jgi:hypothetical protein
LGHGRIPRTVWDVGIVNILFEDFGECRRGDNAISERQAQLLIVGGHFAFFYGFARIFADNLLSSFLRRVVKNQASNFAQLDARFDNLKRLIAPMFPFLRRFLIRFCNAFFLRINFVQLYLCVGGFRPLRENDSIFQTHRETTDNTRNGSRNWHLGRISCGRGR